MSYYCRNIICCFLFFFPHFGLISAQCKNNCKDNSCLSGQDLERMEAISISPNPFNSHTKFSFSIVQPNYVNLTVYNLLGEKQSVIIKNKFFNTGDYQINWSSSDLPSGLYFIDFRIGNNIFQKQLSIIK